jgi:Protein of unknown function (DUF2845)
MFRAVSRKLSAARQRRVDMSSWSTVGTAILIGTLTAGAASAANTGGMRCGTRLVSVGDTQYEVRATCGPPDASQQRTETRTVRHQVRVPCADGRKAWCTTMVESAIEVSVEEWVYDFGTRRFLQHLTFEQGRLVRVESGERGHKDL